MSKREEMDGLDIFYQKITLSLSINLLGVQVSKLGCLLITHTGKHFCCSQEVFANT